MCDAVTAVLPSGPRVGVKWPNDVQVDGRKVCGILSELVPPSASSPGLAVVIGAGLNVTMSEQQLPVPTATSLVLAGADPADLFDRVRAAVIERCTTIGREVRVELPGGAELLGRATGIDAMGRLEVRGADGQVRAVAAGDIIHLRSDR
jgi:BirA family biotin operon repressor/biotin-[acetyl-CoA-carboxylase] ligase